MDVLEFNLPLYSREKLAKCIFLTSVNLGIDEKIITRLMTSLGTQFLNLNGYENITLDDHTGRGSFGEKKIFIKTFEIDSFDVARKYRKKFAGLQQDGILDHTGIFYSLVDDTPLLYVTTEWIDGVQIFDQKIEKLSLVDKIHISENLIQVVKNLHQKGWAHGDLQPENILVDQRLNIHLVDFDTAWRLESPPTDLGTLYIPPEGLLFTKTEVQLNPKYVGDIKYDYWVLGCVLYSLLSENPMPCASTFMIEMGLSLSEYENIYQRIIINEIPESLNKTIDKLLAKDPDNRNFIEPSKF